MAAAAPPRTTSLPWALLGLDGRVSREVFWLGNLGCGLIAVILMSPSIDPNTNELQLAPLSPFVFAALFWTEVALAVKRLHDRGLTGWFALVFAIPIVGIAAFLILGFMPGDRGPNAYGPGPNTRGPL